MQYEFEPGPGLSRKLLPNQNLGNAFFIFGIFGIKPGKIKSEFTSHMVTIHGCSFSKLFNAAPIPHHLPHTW
jgi:hypothetical protein